MILIFTNHAKNRMIERNITEEEIREIIDFPDYTVSKEGKIEAHKKINNRNLKIIYYKEGKFIKIATVIDRT